MAKWINIPVVGGVSTAAQATSNKPEFDGDNLVLADDIVTVSAAQASGADVLTLTLKDGKKIEAIVSTSSSAAPDANVPTSTNYLNKIKAAANRAITANPGGVKSTVSLPQDQDNQAKYAIGKTVYFRSFIYS